MASSARKAAMSTGLTPSTPSRANSRAALVEAAFKEFTDKGYEAATLATIADLAGVTTGAVYAHFAGKLDLLLATVGLTPIADVAASLQASAPRRHGDVSRSLARGLGQRPDAHRVLLLDVIVMARRDPLVAETLRSGLEGYVRVTAQAVDAAAAQGLISPVASADAISRLLAVVNLGMIVFAALDAAPPPASAIERAVDAMLPASGDATIGHDDALARVRAGAAGVDRAQAELRDSIAAAISAGHSLRTVGTAAGLSHEAVRRIASSGPPTGRSDHGVNKHHHGPRPRHEASGTP